MSGQFPQNLCKSPAAIAVGCVAGCLVGGTLFISLKLADQQMPPIMIGVGSLVLATSAAIGVGAAASGFILSSGEEAHASRRRQEIFEPTIDLNNLPPEFLPPQPAYRPNGNGQIVYIETIPDQTSNQPTNRATNQPTSQPTNQSNGQVEYVDYLGGSSVPVDPSPPTAYRPIPGMKYKSFQEVSNLDDDSAELEYGDEEAASDQAEFGEDPELEDFMQYGGWREPTEEDSQAEESPPLTFTDPSFVVVRSQV